MTWSNMFSRSAGNARIEQSDEEEPLPLRLRSCLGPRVPGQGPAWIDAGLRWRAEAGRDQGGFGLRLLTCRSPSPRHPGSTKSGREGIPVNRADIAPRTIS